MDPDMVKEMKDRQGRILNIQNQLQTGDYSGYVAALLLPTVFPPISLSSCSTWTKNDTEADD